MSLIMGSQPVRAVLVWDLLGLQNMQNNALLLRTMQVIRKRFFNNIWFIWPFYTCADVKEGKKPD